MLILTSCAIYLFIIVCLPSRRIVIVFSQSISSSCLTISVSSFVVIVSYHYSRHFHRMISIYLSVLVKYHRILSMYLFILIWFHQIFILSHGVFVLCSISFSLLVCSSQRRLRNFPLKNSKKVLGTMEHLPKSEFTPTNFILP